MTAALPAWTRVPLASSDRVIAAGLVAAGALAIMPVSTPIVVKAAIFGFIGWKMEAIYETKPRWSAVFGRYKVPFLPVYAAGGLAILALAPHLAWMPLLARGAVYAGTLSALEWGACKLDRMRGNCSWDYANASCATDGGCVDGEHAAAWGVLGLLVERLT